jgi:hypothetical protein
LSPCFVSQISYSWTPLKCLSSDSRTTSTDSCPAAGFKTTSAFTASRPCLHGIAAGRCRSSDKHRRIHASFQPPRTLPEDAPGLRCLQVGHCFGFGQNVLRVGDGIRRPASPAASAFRQCSGGRRGALSPSGRPRRRQTPARQSRIPRRSGTNKARSAHDCTYRTTDSTGLRRSTPV